MSTVEYFSLLFILMDLYHLQKAFAYMKLYEVIQLMSDRNDTQTQHKPYSDAWKTETVSKG